MVLKMENLSVKIRKFKRIFAVIMAVLTMASMFTATVTAGGAGGAGGNQQASGGGDTGENAFDSLMDFVVSWFFRIGAAVALFGGFQIVLSLKSSDSTQQENGLKTLAAGAGAMALAGASMAIFGIGSLTGGF